MYQLLCSNLCRLKSLEVLMQSTLLVQKAIFSGNGFTLQALEQTIWAHESYKADLRVG